MPKGILAFLSCVALLVTLEAGAVPHEEATVLMSSGERVRGELLDIHDGFVFLRTDGRPHELPADEVVLIDLEGDASRVPDDELQRAQRDGLLVVLRDGSMIAGHQLTAGGGDFGPSWITLETDRGFERQFRAGSVSRIYLGGAHATAENGPFGLGPRVGQTGDAAKEITVPADRPWTETGIWVERGDRVRFDARGRIHLSDDRQDAAAPAGVLQQEPAGEDAPLPGELAGALVGRVGTSEPFGIGNQRDPLPMPATGMLYLGVNDGALRDNRGEFHVAVEVTDRAGER